ncbi:MAG TPA: YcxB family protein [Pyrinomonadaceae bacterium]|nr:YcxB family protein [Pyrinomonadaceae bacterium]
MNHIQRTKTETADDSYSVEFFPSTDDYVHIALKTSQAVPTPTPIKFAYQSFLVFNAVGFPAFLWFNEFFLMGILLLAVNIAALGWVIPWFMASGLRKYYEHTIGPRENTVALVELSSQGITYWADDAEAFWPWRKFTSIEETDETIFFYFHGNGIAVRKSGFAYHEQEVAFIRAANLYLEASRPPQLDQ